MSVQNVEVTKKNTNTDFTYPQYRNNCISNIPDTILQIFDENEKSKHPLENKKRENNVERIKKVVLIVIDGFGFNQFQKYQQDNQFLANLTNKGEVHPLTSVFPSQTTNALTTLNTGLTPQEHGLFEYYIYLKEAGIVNALRFERIGTKKSKLIEQGFDPHLMYSGGNIQRRLQKEGIKTYTHMNASNASLACTKLVFEGSTIMSTYKNSDAIVKLRKNIEQNRDSAYFFVHLETLDTISHEYGPESQEYNAELQAITFLLQKELVEKLNPQAAQETLLLLTADHGGVQVAPEETIYLSLNSESITNAKIGAHRKKIMPTGSPRDIFLHVKEQKLLETKEALIKSIGKKAQVLETQEALQAGLFGVGKPNSDFLTRTGNLLVMPYGRETLWFEHRSGRKIPLRGQHGGLNAEEMWVPFAAAKLSDLQKS
jgi:predicted AlkP superfamily pyrophosphatase or phosphodiesterase